jgi:hypothetical protein
MVLGPNTICKGDTAYLATTGAVNYTWNTVPQSSTLALSPSITTVYTVIGTNSMGCSSQSLYTLYVRAKLNPTATVSSSSVCLGSSILFFGLLNTNTANPIYSWTGPGSFSSNIFNPYISAALPIHVGIYTLTINNLGCIETTTTQVNAVTPIPNLSIVGPTVICVGENAKLSALGANSYTWVNNASNNYSITVSPSVNTTYTLLGNTNNCESYLYYTLKVDECMAIIDIDNAVLKIFPNPAKTQITLNATTNQIGKTLKVYDALGKVVYESIIKQEQSNISITHWANGIYTVAIPEQGLTYKFVKE